MYVWIIKQQHLRSQICVANLLLPITYFYLLTPVLPFSQAPDAANK